VEIESNEEGREREKERVKNKNENFFSLLKKIKL
jgi:hypothetical protein